MTVPVILEQWLQAEHQPDSPRDHREVHHQLDISLGMSGLFRTSDGCSSVLLASADFCFLEFDIRDPSNRTRLGR